MAGKRRFGSVRKLPSGRWQARYLGPDGVMRPADETFGTKGEADQWLVRKEAEILSGEWIDPDAGKVPLSIYATKWLAERPKMRASTRARCEPLIRLHISPYLGDKLINEVRPAHIRTWYKQLADNGIGAATIARAYQLLKAIFNTAFKDDEAIKRNPCRIDGAATYIPKERPVLSMSQVFAVADSVPSRYRAMVLLATFASLRWGEVAGLRRKNIDLKACTVRVETTVIELGGTLLTDQEPKSEAGRRVVAFPDQLRPVLVAHLRDYVADDPDAYVFTSPRGSVLRRSNFRDEWIKATTAAGAAGFRFHDLRHTGATVAAQTGATLRELMNRVGHSTTRAAIIYQHAADGRDQKIAAALDKLIKAEQSKKRADRKRQGRKPPTG